MKVVIVTIALLSLVGLCTAQSSVLAKEPYMRELGRTGVIVDDRREAVDALIREMKANYVLPEIAGKIETELLAWVASAEFKELTEPNAFTSRVNEILKSNVTDAHLRFRFSATVLPVRQSAGEPSESEIAGHRAWIRRENSLFRSIERLEGNIGYFAFDMFLGHEEVRRPMAAVMHFLKDTDAMIIDLRENRGGNPEGVQMVCSYFFGETPVHLNSIYFRPTGLLQEFWTLKELDAPRYLDKPVYVLVSKGTGSGAEECAYNLQQLKRGTIIGEPTWGGANPGGVFRLTDHYSCFIPVGRAENPYTKTNWEGTGVIPDVRVDPAKAKEAAQLALVQLLAANEADADYKASLEALAKRLKSSGD